ncbi:uncharacterized protein LOC129920252 [Episyrphus balteatus]|uniref:uncharacterized protein LOC129920252 n=1 Tax=Episyrphus balteatus TaxID=286459 RepID=UPI0024855479|nr:uncharacterized protein LOC129920252 [Episyrphus balteatus]XP_055857502.1 uncharacterized protein LOC129920252 [Episyrphus balteatus]XP_055857503.1 uncharacterized protein LOC129920252 [Episyrphus balteatus]XP_055857504.1 uncharacterized protein LOC129920252 [Episyrphus balteatus]XP_055857505.1 uncharacterized protein LOC129920252 [Episyrphus balteatus]XP_055857506.1 uncharacterized protein LOC129920252 [Episyrphus balteatus]XP_055857507.1 uncharacterized protein LOC129920252 [Episyrphus b
MCRCCQSCYEDIYWNCFEEKFCYDESIANYNPDEDEEYIVEKNGALGRIHTIDNNNLPVCNQPLGRGNSMLSAKIHEEDYRRETQMNVPMLGPEILAVFANSQIFQDHQPTKLTRIGTRSYLPGVHATAKDLTSPRDVDQDKLIKRLEDNLDEAVKIINGPPVVAAEPTTTAEKRITFTITSDSSPEDALSLKSKASDGGITEETNSTSSTYSPKSTTDKLDSVIDEDEKDEVILRPRAIDRHQHLKLNISPPKRPLRSAKSVPHFNVRTAASETDIFAISGSISRISMTPEVPSISFSNLPKNYEDTPTIEKYKVSQSLYSIQTANQAKAGQDDYSMPRYFRCSALLTQSSDNFPSSSANSSTDDITPRKLEKEKSKRLKALREALPPLSIPSLRKRDETKQLD